MNNLDHVKRISEIGIMAGMFAIWVVLDIKFLYYKVAYGFLILGCFFFIILRLLIEEDKEK
jgi:hypothetical protein